MFHRKDAKTQRNRWCALAAICYVGVVAGQAPSGTVALVGARVIDGTGAAPIANRIGVD